MSVGRVFPRKKTELEKAHERRKQGLTPARTLKATGIKRAPMYSAPPLPTGDKRWLNQNTKDLAAALLAINTEEEMAHFLRDLMTTAEIKEFGIRWQAARMLADGQSYTKVGFATNLSSRTISRIKRWLTEGMGGYALALRRLKK